MFDEYYKVYDLDTLTEITENFERSDEMWTWYNGGIQMNIGDRGESDSATLKVLIKGIKESISEYIAQQKNNGKKFVLFHKMSDDNMNKELNVPNEISINGITIPLGKFQGKMYKDDKHEIYRITYLYTSI